MSAFVGESAGMCNKCHHTALTSPAPELVSWSLNLTQSFVMTDPHDLIDRLNDLKGNQQPTLPLHELHERVARLKGLDPANYTAPPITVYTSADRRSDQQKADDLLSHLMSQTQIDQQVSASGTRRMSDAEMEIRLLRLRGGHPDQSLPKNVPDDSPPDSEDETDKIISKALAESRLPHAASHADDEDDEMTFPWCVICNDDAKISCQDCDSDLYCADCFAEFHSDPDTRKHRTRTLT